jgi:hypothetical protein
MGRVLERFSFESLVAWWIGPRDAARRSGRLLVVLLLLICAAEAIIGVPRLRIFGHDIFVSLDGGWRVLHGQRPGVDFFGQMGAAYYLLHATGLWLSGNDARGLGYGSTIATAGISFWAFFVLKPRMKPAPFFVTCLFLALLAAAPFPLGFNPGQTAFSMKHNRYGYALTALVLLESFLPRDAGSRKLEFGGGFSTGLACALLLFLKISYGLVALTFAVISLPLRSSARTGLAGMAAGFAAFCLPMMIYLRFDLPALLREYHQLAGVQGGSLNPYIVAMRLYIDRYEIAPVVLLVALVSLLPWIPVRRKLTLAAVVAMAVLAGDLLLLTNTTPFGLPLLAAAALLLLNEVTGAIPAGSLQHRPAQNGAIKNGALQNGSAPVHAAPLLAIGLLIAGIPMCVDATGVAMAIEDKALSRTPGYRFHEPALASVEFIDCAWPSSGPFCYPNDNGQNFVRYTEEGIALVQANSRPDESVRGMGMSNPFSFALQRAPSRGGAVNLSATNIRPTAMPPKKMLLGDVGLILQPKFPATERDTMAAILDAYPELLGTEYLRVAESPNWILYRRSN